MRADFVRSSGLLPTLMVLLASLSLSVCGGEGVPNPVDPGQNEPDPIVMGVEGGTKTHETGVVVSAPAGAVTGTVSITVQETATSSQVTDEDREGNVFNLGPNGTVFQVPVEVRLPWPAGFSGDSADLLVFTTDAAGNPELLDELQVSQGTFVSGKTLHFSPFWVSSAGGRPNTVEISPGSLSLAAGESASLAATVLNLLGRQIQMSVNWSSSDASIASVSSDGTVTGALAGTATITARAGGASASVAVTVAVGPPSSIAISPTSVAIRVDESQLFAVSVSDVAGNDLGTPSNPQWTSSNLEYATVDSDGLATGLALGLVDISVTAGGLTASAALQVLLPLSETGFRVSPAQLTILRDQSGKLSARLIDDLGNATSVSADWTSRDEGIATVDGDGAVSGVSVGDVWIVATADGQADSSLVSVTSKDPASVSVTPGLVDLSVGEAATFSAAVKDQDGEELSVALTWASKNPGIASIDGQGRVTALSPGVVNVSATTSNGVSDDAIVRVFSRDPVSLRVTPDPVNLQSGANAQLTATPWDVLGKPTTFLPGQDLVWVSGDQAVATVDANGLVSALAVGETTVTATAGTLTDQVTVTVTRGAAVTVEFITPPGDVTVAAGVETPVSVRGTDAQGNVFVDDGVTLQSSNEGSVQVVNPTAFVGQTVGAATLTASIDGVDASIEVTVVPGAAGQVVFITPNANVTVAAGDVVALDAEVRDVAGNDTGDAVVFTSSAPASVRIEGTDGNAEKVGTSTIRATSGELSATVDITVEPGAPTEVEFTTPAAAQVDLGDGDQLQTIAVARDAFGNEFTNGLAYRSSNEAVASVNSTGLVSGLSLGQAYIVVEINPADSFLVQVVAGALSAVAVSPNGASFDALGGAVGFTASPTDSKGNAIDGVAFDWSLSAGGVITLAEDGSNQATVTSVGNGTVQLTVSATKGGITREDVVTVTVAVVPASVVIDPDTHTLNAISATVDLAPLTTVKDGNGNVIPGAAVVWTSLEAGIAAVSTSGVVTSVAAGVARIVATSGSVSDTAMVSVVQTAATVRLSPDAAIDIGADQALVLEVRDSGGTPISSPLVQYASSNSSIATVSETGVVSGVTSGVVTITATVDGVTGTATIAVIGSADIFSSALVGGASPADAQAGSSIQVAIVFDMSRISANGDLGAVQFDLDYDPAVFEYQSATAGIGGATDFNDNGNGKLAFGLATTNPFSSPTFTLVTATFTVKAGTPVGTERTLLLTYTATPAKTDFSNLPEPIVLSGRVRVTQ
jgi:Big-like domain-containing protein